jgi:uncharacterized protein YbjQ (UPF0145 family)
VSIAFLYTNNYLTEKEIKETISYVIATTTKMNDLRITLTKEMKDLYTGNYKILRKEIREDIYKRKATLCS